MHRLLSIRDYGPALIGVDHSQNSLPIKDSPPSCLAEGPYLSISEQCFANIFFFSKLNYLGFQP